MSDVILETGAEIVERALQPSGKIDLRRPARGGAERRIVRPVAANIVRLALRGNPGELVAAAAFRRDGRARRRARAAGAVPADIEGAALRLGEQRRQEKGVDGV